MQGIPETFKGKQRRYVWEYRNISGNPQGYVARYDDGRAKEVIPFFNRTNGHGWKSGNLPESRSLFGLDVLAQADINLGVFIVEGEKAAAALQSLGLVAVTSQGGSKAADKTDWQPLNERKQVYLLPDNDEPGESYIQDVTSILAALEKPPTIYIVRLPDLPPAGDIVDWIAAFIKNVLLDWDGYEPIPQSFIDNGKLLAAFKQAVKKYREPVPDEWMTGSAQLKL